MVKKQKTKKNKICYQRLSRIITSRECRSAQDYLIELYDRLSPESRQGIKTLLLNNSKKEMLNRNRSLTF